MTTAVRVPSSQDFRARVDMWTGMGLFVCSVITGRYGRRFLQRNSKVAASFLYQSINENFLQMLLSDSPKTIPKKSNVYTKTGDSGTSSVCKQSSIAWFHSV